MSNQASPDQLARIYEALRLDPNNGQLYNNLGCIYYRQGQIGEAISTFEKAIRLDPANFEAHYNLGNCYVKQDMLEQAISHYLATLKLDPGHVNAQLNLAMVYVSLKQYANALPYLEPAAQRDPNFTELQGHLAEAYLDLGKSAQAIKQFELATQLDPTRAAWQHNLAVLYLRERKLPQAAARFKQALALDPSNVTAQHMLNALQNVEVKNAPTAYVKDLFDQYANYYNKHVTQSLEYKVPGLLRQAIGPYVPLNNPEIKVLDLGCGTGLCGIYFRDLARVLVGVDVSMPMLEHAQSSTAYDALCCGDINQLILGHEYFDIIIAADVLGYIGDLKTIFANVSTALKPRGLFAFTVEDYAGTNFVLQTSGRFAHAKDYIQTLMHDYNFNILQADNVTLRKDQQQNIEGTLYVVQKA